MAPAAKAEALLGLLKEFARVRIFILAVAPGVKLPPAVVAHAKKENGGVTALDVGLNLPIPIVGLKVDEFGVRGTFSFAHVAHPVEIPWAAIGGARVEDDGKKAPAVPKLTAVPKDLAFDPALQDFSKVPVVVKRPRSRLRLVPAPAKEAA